MMVMIVVVSRGRGRGRGSLIFGGGLHRSEVVSTPGPGWDLSVALVWLSEVDRRNILRRLNRRDAGVTAGERPWS